MHCNLLDRDFHTPSLVCSRSPFLLTTSTQFPQIFSQIINNLDSSLFNRIKILHRASRSSLPLNGTREEARIRCSRSRLQIRRNRTSLPPLDFIRLRCSGTVRKRYNVVDAGDGYSDGHGFEFASEDGNE